MALEMWLEPAGCGHLRSSWRGGVREITQLPCPRGTKGRDESHLRSLFSAESPSLLASATLEAPGLLLGLGACLYVSLESQNNYAVLSLFHS